MIDESPLHMFDKDNAPTATPEPPVAPEEGPVAPDATSSAAPEATPLHCQVCGQESPASTLCCPACGMRLRPLGAPAGEVSAEQPLECQWCDALLPPGATSCPACGSKAPDPSLQLLGLNVTRPSDEIEFERASYDALDNRYVHSDLRFGVAGVLLRIFGRRL